MEISSLPPVVAPAAPAAHRPAHQPADRPAPAVTPMHTPQVTVLNASFEVDMETKHVRIKIVDQEGNLVRVIPPETVTDMIAALASYPRPR